MELIKEGELTPDKPSCREQTCSTAKSGISEPISLWDRLKQKFEQVGGHTVDLTIKKASYAGRDLETGWLLHNYDLEDSIRGIMVLRAAPDLVATAASNSIFIEDENDGVVLTPNPIRWPDVLQWNDKTYEVKNVDEKRNGYDLSFYVAKLALVIGEKKASHLKTQPDKIYNARSQIRTFLIRKLDNTKITKEDDFTKAVYSVIYMNPPYPITKEFFNSNNPVDGVYAIHEPKTSALLGHTGRPSGYEERVPISIFTINKTGNGTKLKRKMESELWRICEKYSIDSRFMPHLERCGDTCKTKGRTIFHSTEFILSFSYGISNT